MLLGGGNLKRSAFDNLNFFHSWKQHSVHVDYQLKSKLAWAVSTKSIQLKWKWYGSYEHSLKYSFYQFITWKLVCSEGDKKFFAGSLLASNFFLVGRWISEFLASEWRLYSILLVRETLQFLPSMSPNFTTLFLMIHYADIFLTWTC